MTPGSVRAEEERLEQAPGNRPEERMGPQDTASLACHRQSGGRATQKLKEETTRWEEPLQLPVPEPWSDNDSKGKGKGKMGGKLPSCRTNEPLGKKASSRKPSRENAQRLTSAQNPELKPPSTPTKPQFPRKPGRRRMKRTGGAAEAATA